MSEQLNHRIAFLEQKVTVMQKEVSEVIGEMQTTMEAIAKTYSVAITSMLERLNALENSTQVSGTNTDEIDRAGKEL